jgi:hypothetical protein
MQKRRENSACVARLIRALALVATLASQHCGPEKSARDEAHEVLERIARLDPDAPPAARRAAIEAVAAAPVTDKALDELRSVCVQAHRGLLEAEVAQAEVHEALLGQEPPTPDALTALEAKRQQAAASLSAGLTALDTCEKLSRDATVRYR